MKRAIALMLMLTVILACLPAVSLAAKQMEDGVPVWNEETVRQYALDYIEGKSMSRLWGYYDLQIRRYMPMETYEAMLTDLEWMTGAFIELGSYRCFEEPENQLKTHVLHLIMEKQDLDMYFTHKNKEDGGNQVNHPGQHTDKLNRANHQATDNMEYRKQKLNPSGNIKVETEADRLFLIHRKKQKNHGDQCGQVHR